LGPEYAGHYFFNTKSTNKPGAVDAHGHDILGSQDIVSGDYGRVSLNAYAYDQAGNKGVSYGLNNIMLLSKGDSLGGAKPSAASDFGVVAGKASAPVAAESIDNDWWLVDQFLKRQVQLIDWCPQWLHSSRQPPADLGLLDASGIAHGRHGDLVSLGPCPDSVNWFHGRILIAVYVKKQQIKNNCCNIFVLRHNPFHQHKFSWLTK